MFDVILSGCFVKYIGDMISQIYCIQYLPCSGCDVIDRLDVMTHAVDVRTDTVDLISYIKWCDVLKSGYDVIERRSVVMNFVNVMT